MNKMLRNIMQGRVAVAFFIIVFVSILPKAYATESMLAIDIDAAADLPALDMTLISANVDYLQRKAPSDTKMFKVATIEPSKNVEQKQKAIVVTKKVSVDQQSLHDYQEAVRYLQQGRVAEAQDMLRNALEIDPAFDDARQTLVGLLVENNHIDEAMDALKNGIEVSPMSTVFAKILARLQLDSGSTEAALLTLEQGLPYSNDSSSYHVLLAAVLQKLGKHQKAVLHYQHALSRGATSPAWLIGLGVSLEAEGRQQEAKIAFGKAQQSQLNPTLALFVSQRLKQLR